MSDLAKMNDLERRAALFAANAHANQVRKYSFAPYIVHPAAVAEIVREAMWYSHEALAAAWLHDVVEDCSVDLRTIQDHFGLGVAQLVDDVTRRAHVGPQDGSRAERAAIHRRRLANAQALSQTIKVADILDNTKTIVRHDPQFARVYLVEKAADLDVLVRADRALLERARRQVAQRLDAVTARDNIGCLTATEGRTLTRFPAEGVQLAAGDPPAAPAVRRVR